MNKAGVRAVIYVRFSSDLQDRRSNDDQIAADAEYARRKGLKVVLPPFRDDAISGASVHNRPGIQALMRAAAERAFDVVITESLDRLSRSQADIASLYEALKFVGVRIETLDDGGPVSEMHIGLKGTMNALFLQNLAHKTLRGQTGRAKAGRIPGGRLYGYDVVPGEERGLRTKNGVEAEIVRRIFREYVAGVSPMAIVRALNSEGIPSPSGRKWNVSTLIGSPKRENGTLNNPLYAGRLVFKRQSFAKNPATGKRLARANAPEERVITEVPEFAIIDAATWQAAQNLRASRTKVHPPHHRRPKHLLSGLLVCDYCDAKFIVKTTRDGVTYFACSVRTNRGGCENRKTARSDDIERRVLAGLKKLLADPARIELAINAYRAEWKRLKAERAKTRSTTVHELARVETAIANTLKAIHSLGKDGNVEPLAQSIRDLQDQRTQLKVKLAEPKADVVDLHPHAARRCREIIENLNDALAAGGPAAARAIDHVRALIASIRIIPTPGRQPVGIEIEGNLLALIDPDSGRSASEQFGKVGVRV